MSNIWEESFKYARLYDHNLLPTLDKPVFTKFNIGKLNCMCSMGNCVSLTYYHLFFYLVGVETIFVLPTAMQSPMIVLSTTKQKGENS